MQILLLNPLPSNFFAFPAFGGNGGNDGNFD